VETLVLVSFVDLLFVKFSGIFSPCKLIFKRLFFLPFYKCIYEKFITFMKEEGCLENYVTGKVDEIVQNFIGLNYPAKIIKVVRNNEPNENNRGDRRKNG